jgi:four helix bundle protein
LAATILVRAEAAKSTKNVTGDNNCGLRIADCGLTKGIVFMNSDEFKRRTRSFALNVVKLVESLNKSRTTDVIGRQLLKAGTSVGANYRAACRARSQADFISKMGIVEEEADESIYWMELLVDSGVIVPDAIAMLIKEADEIVAMTVSSIKTARTHKEPK